MERQRPRVELSHAHCPYCKAAVRPEEDKEACHACMAWHHAECWTSHGGCSACTALSHAPQAAPAGADGLWRCLWSGCDQQAHTVELPSDYRVRLGGELVHMGRLCPKHAAAGLKGYAATVEGVGAVFLALTIFVGTLVLVSRQLRLLAAPGLLGIITAVCFYARERYEAKLRKIAGKE